MGDLSNGALLSEAAAAFDVVVTVDKSLLHQQNRSDLPVTVVVLRATDNTIDSLALLASDVIRLLSQSLQKRVYVVQK